MTLGEIKAATLQLMGFEEHVDAENIADYEGDGNWGALLRAMWQAINRCMADLESKRVLPLHRHLLQGGERRGTRCRFKYDDIDSLFEPVRLMAEGEAYLDDDHPFFVEGDGYLRVQDYDGGLDYILLFRPRLPRITANTENSFELKLPQGLADAVPYFIKSEVYRQDEPDEATVARNTYEAALAQYREQRNVTHQARVVSWLGVDLT